MLAGNRTKYNKKYVEEENSKKHKHKDVLLAVNSIINIKTAPHEHIIIQYFEEFIPYTVLQIV